MSTLKFSVPVLAFALLLAGCGDASTTSPSGSPVAKGSSAPAASAKMAATATAAPTASVASAEEDVPTEADFEEAAEKDINAENMVAELERLEKEIGADAP